VRRILLAAAGSGGAFTVPPPSPYNDEFTDAGTATSRWTLSGVGGSIYKDINGAVPGSLYLWGTCMQPAPTAPYTITAECIAVDWDTGPHTGNSSVCIAQAAPGPYYFVGVDVGFTGKMDLTSSYFDATGAFTGNYPSLPSANEVTGYGYAIPHRIEVTVHSATNVDARISFDSGGTWTTILSGYNPGVTPNYIGLANGNSRGTWDWFRVT
jgi:hypothetical protein